MPLVVTAVAAAGRAAITPQLAAAIAAVLPGAPAPHWLEHGIACDFEVDATADAAGELEQAVRGLVGAQAIDCFVQPQAHRRKGLLVADMDSTIIGQECIDELAAAVGLKDHVAAITERAMRGEIDFAPALRERVALLAGLERDDLQEVFDTRITVRPGARELVATMRAHGARTALVSGGFSFFTERVAAAVGFDEHHANRLQFDGDRLAGTVEEPILARDAKRETLARLTAAHGLDPAATLAVGDGANDLAMIEAAGAGVAFHAKPAVAAAAAHRVEHADLTALLFMQGYAREQFVSGK